jgi:hypothetical protein
MDVNFANGAEGLIGMDIFSNYLVTLDFPAKKLVLGPLPPRPQGTASSNGLYNRYIAPEMKDFHPIFRTGSDLILPLSVNGRQTMLFVADTAIAPSALSQGAAHEVIEGHRDPKYEVRDAPPTTDYITSVSDVGLKFWEAAWNESTMVSFDTSRFTDDAGMEISGLIGLRTLSGMTLHIDYRDGLLKLDRDPKRKSQLSF